MYRRDGDRKKSIARKRLVKPLLDMWTREDEAFPASINDYAPTAIRRLSKNYRKSAPFAGWSGSDKYLFHNERMKLKEEHHKFDMQDWAKWNEYARQDEEERRDKEEMDYYLMEQEMRWMAEDCFRDDDDNYDPYHEDDRWWGEDSSWPWDDYGYQEENDRGRYDDYPCDCEECTGRIDNTPFYASFGGEANYAEQVRKKAQMERMWAEHKTAQQEEEALAVAESYEMDPEELAEYYYQLQL